MKQLPRDHPGPTPAGERPESRTAPRAARDGMRRPDRLRSHERRPSNGVKPRPARDLNSSEEVVQPAVETDVTEARLEFEGRTWTVRVLGRSGRPSHGEAPLLLLGFWEAASSDEPPSLEASVVGRTLAALTSGHLEEALGNASPPPSQDRKRSFFDLSHPGKRR